MAIIVEGDYKAPFSIATTPKCWEGRVIFNVWWQGKDKHRLKVFLNNYINKKEKQGDKAKNQLYKFVAYNIKWKSESMCVCVKPEFMYGHVCYKLRNSLGGYGTIRVVRVSDDLGGSSSHEQSTLVTAGGVSKIRQSSDEFLWP